MTQCKKCKEIKFCFQFHTETNCLCTEVFDICKRCANKLKNEAVRDSLKN